MVSGQSIRTKTYALQELQKNRIVNNEGNDYALEDATAIMGVTATKIKQNGEVVLFTPFSLIDIDTNDATISIGDYVSTGVDGKCKRYTGTGAIIGIAKDTVKYGSVLVYLYATNPQIGSGGGGGGDITTASNVGNGGVGVFLQKSLDTLEFKNINAGTGITVTNDAANKEVDISVNELTINHNNLNNTHNLTTDIDHNTIANYDSNQHIDHSTLLLNTNADSGLAGGGDLTDSRALSIDITGTTQETSVDGTDEFIMYDTSNTALRKVTKLDFQNSLDILANDEIVSITSADFTTNEYTINVTDLGKLFVVDLTGAATTQTIKLPDASLTNKGKQTGIHLHDGSVNLDITTAGGTQLIGGSVIQSIRQNKETLAVTDNETYYLIRQDSRINKSNVDIIPYNDVTTISTLEDESRYFHSSNKLTGSSITPNAGAGTVDVSAGEWYLRSADNDNAALKPVTVSAVTGLSIPTNSTRYITADYNAGSPIHGIETDITAIPCQSSCVTAIVSRVNSNLDVMELAGHSTDFFSKYARAEAETNWLKHGSGVQIADEGNRNLSVTAGSLYQGVLRYDITGFDTSTADTFTYYYRDGSGGWVEQTGQTQINHTQYDDGSGVLQAGEDKKYYVHSVYIRLNTPTELAVLYPQAVYDSLAEAQAGAGVPGNTPSFGEKYSTGRFIGSIITKYNTVTFEDIRSPFVEILGSSTPTSHNDLSGLHGGVVGEYYHLNLSNHTNLTGGNPSFTTVNATTSLNLNGVDINTSATLNNVAYLDTANVFTNENTFQSNLIVAGSDIAGNTVTDSTNKSIRLAVPHYLSDTVNDITIVNALSLNGNSFLNIGGGTQTAVEKIRLYSAPNDITATGTEMLSVSYSDIIFNDTGVGCDFRVESSTDTHAFYIEGLSGSIGIGTDNPSGYNSNGNNLVIKGTGGFVGLSIVADPDQSSRIYFADGDSLAGGQADERGYIAYNHTNDQLFIGTAANPNFTINSSGQVGIGETTPAHKLHVNADTSVTTSSFSTNSSDASIIRLRNNENGNEWSWGVAGSSNVHTSGGHMYFYDEASGLKAMDIASGSGNAYFIGDVSALSFTDRTPYPYDLQTAIDSIFSMERLPENEYDKNKKENQLDHSKLHKYIQSEDGQRDLSATVSCQNEVIKYLYSEINRLERMIRR